MTDRIQHYADKLKYETDSWDLNEAMQNGEGVVVIDARSPEAFAEAHIPGAISFPHRTMNADSTADLDREALSCYILRRHRLQCLNKGCAQYGAVRISCERVDGRLGLVEARWLPYRNWLSGFSK